MQQPVAPPSADSDDIHRKAKLLALLDRARVNRGLQPELNGDAVDAMDVPLIKPEPTDSTVFKSEPNTPHSQEQETPKCTCNHSHQMSSASMTSPNAHNRAHNDQKASGERDRHLNNSSTIRRAESDAVASTGSSRNHSRTNSESSVGNSMTIQTANSDSHHRVAVLSSTPKPRIANFTGRERVPRLQQLKPLEVPRNNEMEPREKPEKRELPPRAQMKQVRSPTNQTVTWKKLELLTPDEYEDSELHGDFQHMLHILIPSNATTALLERRGQPIQSISQQAGCTLSIREPEASPFRDDRLLRIYGKAKGISLAQRLVIAYIRVYRADKGDPNYMDLSDKTPPVALPATSITKAMSVAVTSGKKNELEITSPFHWMVQRDDVGKLMGRQGSTIEAIRRDTGAVIHLDEDVVPGTTERRVVLIGSVDSIAAALEEIKNKSGGRPEVSASAASGRLGQYFAIPYHAAGYLIGPQGSTIKSITERTGARLQIPSAEDLPLGSVNRIIHMQGNPKQAEHARRVVGAKLRDYLASPKCPKTLIASSTGRKGDKVTIKVILPSRICGFMLDQHGKLIHEISEKSGAYTHFLTPHDDDSRVCVFTGDISCVLRAQRLVLQVIAGDAISSKRIAPPRKRKRSQREEQEERYSEGEDEYREHEESYYEDAEEYYYDDEYEEAPRVPVRRQNVRRRPPRRPRHEYEEDYDMYRHDDDMEEVNYEKRPRQPIRRRPVATCPRDDFDDEYAVDEYEVDEYDHDEYAHNENDHDEYAHNEYDDEDRVRYDIPRPRLAKRPAIVRRQPVSRRRDGYDDDYQEYDDEFTYADSANDNEYEPVSIARKQLIKRRPVGNHVDDRRPRVVLPGRKVQMVVPRSSPREGQPRMSPPDRRRTNGNTSVRPISRGGSANVRRSVPRGGRGSGRPSPGRGGRGNGNKRRRH